MKPITATTCTRAWLDAVTHLQGCAGERDYNVILEIAEPMALREDEKPIHKAVNQFLDKYDKPSLHTIVNTIFPAGIYARQGGDEVIANYRQIAGKIRKHPEVRWGTYAYRMMAERTDTKNRKFVPLQAIIDKLRTQLSNTGTLRAAYELNLVDPVADIPIYEAELDHGHAIGGPCLSHVSFKLKDDHRLMLTAFYRSHYYVQRALGNLYGLAWLQDFVARQVGTKTAELVCISSMAVLETESNRWGKAETDSLASECRKHLQPQPTCTVAPANVVLSSL